MASRHEKTKPWLKGVLLPQHQGTVLSSGFQWLLKRQKASWSSLQQPGWPRGAAMAPRPMTGVRRVLLHQGSARAHRATPARRPRGLSGTACTHTYPPAAQSPGNCHYHCSKEALLALRAPLSAWLLPANSPARFQHLSALMETRDQDSGDVGAKLRACNRQFRLFSLCLCFKPRS